jgi:hypothetical protein
LLAADESDPQLKKEAANYGTWYSYLTKHLTDTDEDNI